MVHQEAREEDLKTYLHRYLQPFKASLEGNRELQTAVLLNMSCTEAMRYLYNLAKQLLAGKAHLPHIFDA
jgi:hypothetical protein